MQKHKDECDALKAEHAAAMSESERVHAKLVREAARLEQCLSKATAALETLAAATSSHAKN